jgi:hypothetical protein
VAALACDGHRAWSGSRGACPARSYAIQCAGGRRVTAGCGRQPWAAGHRRAATLSVGAERRLPTSGQQTGDAKDHAGRRPSRRSEARQISPIAESSVDRAQTSCCAPEARLRSSAGFLWGRGEHRPGRPGPVGLWFPPMKIPLGHGQEASPPVIVGVAGYSRLILGRMVPSRQGHDSLGGHLACLPIWVGCRARCV